MRALAYRQTRESWIPKHAATDRRTDPRLPGAEVYLYQHDRADGATTYYALAFSGKRQRPDWHYSFRLPLERERYVTTYLDKLAQSAVFRADRKAKERTAELEARAQVAIGQIYSGSWGYDQTQVEFWEVVEVRGAMAILRECGQTRVEPNPHATAAMADHCLPESCPAARTIRRKILAGPAFHVHDCCTVFPWDGRPEYRSWYA